MFAITFWADAMPLPNDAMIGRLRMLLLGIGCAVSTGQTIIPLDLLFRDL